MKSREPGLGRLPVAGFSVQLLELYLELALSSPRPTRARVKTRSKGRGVQVKIVQVCASKHEHFYKLLDKTKTIPSQYEKGLKIELECYSSRNQKGFVM